MPTVPEGQKVSVRGSHVDFASRALLHRLVDETEGYEGRGVGIVGFVEVDGTQGDGDVSTFGKVCSVGEGERFTGLARHNYCREKQW